MLVLQNFLSIGVWCQIFFSFKLGHFLWIQISVCVYFPRLCIHLVINQVITREAPWASQERYCITASYNHHNNLSSMPLLPTLHGRVWKVLCIVFVAWAYASIAKTSHCPSGRTCGVECALCMYMCNKVGDLGRYSKSNNDSKHWTWYICADEPKLISVVMRWSHSISLGLYCGSDIIQTLVNALWYFETIHEMSFLFSPVPYSFYHVTESSIW